MIQKADVLERFPRMGRVVREFGDDRCRQLIWKQYRIIYWIDESPRPRVLILAVVHRARLLRNIFSIDDK
ncbi:MAG: type II toxin-antitoxin system RelE/ParE family toxin [Planctomycetes bacterium]|nr:type II toxin-antitoxin system RelE/ParE family toxin [Planctomycetota bacterium]